MRRSMCSFLFGKVLRKKASRASTMKELLQSKEKEKMIEKMVLKVGEKMALESN